MGKLVFTIGHHQPATGPTDCVEALVDEEFQEVLAFPLAFLRGTGCVDVPEDIHEPAQLGENLPGCLFAALHGIAVGVDVGQHILRLFFVKAGQDSFHHARVIDRHDMSLVQPVIDMVLAGGIIFLWNQVVHDILATHLDDRFFGLFFFQFYSNLVQQLLGLFFISCGIDKEDHCMRLFFVIGLSDRHSDFPAAHSL